MLSRRCTISFENTRTVILPARSPYANDLVFARQARRPVLVKTTADQVVTFAGSAWISGVNRTKRVRGGLLVFLRGRSSALLLPRRHDNFNQLAGLFTNAAKTNRVLAVAQTMTGRVITDAVPSKTQRLSGERNERRRRPPVLKLRPAPEDALARALRAFRSVVCEPARPTSGAERCVPFNFPEHGCNARAAFMCAEFKRRRIDSGKIFCFAGKSLLRASSPNSPCGRVTWPYHVAAVVRMGGDVVVVDPALSPTPVKIPVWKRLMAGGSSATVVVTRADVYGLDQPNGRNHWTVHFDTIGARAADELADARASLKMSANYYGSPPYKKPVTSCV